MKNRSQFCLDTVLTEFPGLAERADQDSRLANRLDRLKQLRGETARQRASQIETMIADFERIATILEDDIIAEQDRTGIRDPAHFAYSTSARAMIQRRDNLKRSIGELQRQRADTKIALD
jgi:flagellar FliJ protein